MSVRSKISVITPSFNSIHTIRDTIESVRSQDYPHWEHIIIDGGSKDGTVELLKEYPHLIWVSEKDEGHYHAMNKGILRATGEIVNILNADDCFRPGALSAVNGAFQQHPEWDALFGDIQYVNGEGRNIYRREEACYDYDVLRCCGWCYVIHQTLFVRKSVHDRLGMYLHKEFMNCCDYEFILRLGKHGCKVGHVPRLLVNYRIHEYGQTADLRIQRNMHREAAIICKEHGRPDGWLGRLYRTAFRLKRQWQKLICRGRVDLIPGIWILRVRRQMKKQTSFTSNIETSKLREKD
ncbi:MAG: glycosyltransferase family 2 protein [Limisphaerales bacterium]